MKERIEMKYKDQVALDKAAREEHDDLARRTGDAVRLLDPVVQAAFGRLSQIIAHWNTAQGFWDSENTGEKIALMHSELSEALEADRKDLDSDHIPEFTGVEEELADCMIRIFDFAGHHELRLAEAFSAKLEYNLTRPYRHGKGY